MIDAKTIEELRALLAKATPGPWEADNENNDGCYGLGDDCHEGFQSASIHAPDGRGGYIKLFDALNSDVACIEEEWDEDQHYAWDEVSRANAALIVAMRNALPDLLDAAERAVRHHNKSRAESSEALVAELREKVERYEMALEDIYRVGDGYNKHRPEDGKYAGTTGEGHARCREIARRTRSELEGR